MSRKKNSKKNKTGAQTGKHESKQQKGKKLSKRSKIIIAIICAAVLIAIGIYAAVNSANNANDEEDETSVETEVVGEDQSEDLTDAVNDYEDSNQDEEIALIDDPTTKDYENGISFEEEDDGAELTFVSASVSEFYGTWKSTSGQADYFYGGVKITIKKDKTWKGTITDEDYSGVWSTRNGGLYLTSDVFNCNLRFTDTGKLIMQQDYGDEDVDPVAVVLTKQ